MMLVASIGICLAIAFYAIILLFEKKEEARIKRTASIESRRHIRNGNDPLVRCFCLLPDGKMIDCFIVDWSDGGLGVFIRSDYFNFHKASDLTIKSTRCCAGKWLEVRICHIRPEAHGYFIGCQFKEPLTKEILEAYTND